MEPENHYLVIWECDSFAKTPEQAALEMYQRYFAKDHFATVFDVIDGAGNKVRVDIEELEG